MIMTGNWLVPFHAIRFQYYNIIWPLRPNIQYSYLKLKDKHLLNKKRRNTFYDL